MPDSILCRHALHDYAVFLQEISAESQRIKKLQMPDCSEAVGSTASHLHICVGGDTRRYCRTTEMKWAKAPSEPAHQPMGVVMSPDAALTRPTTPTVAEPEAATRRGSSSSGAEVAAIVEADIRPPLSPLTAGLPLLQRPTVTTGSNYLSTLTPPIGKPDKHKRPVLSQAVESGGGGDQQVKRLRSQRQAAAKR